MVEIVCAVVAAISAVIVALVSNNIKRSNIRMEDRAKLRQRESLLSLRMMDATLRLSVVTSNAVTGGHNNGNVEEARKAANEAAAEYEKFMQEITAHEIGK